MLLVPVGNNFFFGRVDLAKKMTRTDWGTRTRTRTRKRTRRINGPMNGGVTKKIP